MAGSRAVVTLGAAAMLVTGMADAPRPPQRDVLVIAHRGASGHYPEHTLGGYACAIAMGADYIEPDLVMTKDGVLVARHENEISGTTDVADRPAFADRKTTKTIDGESVTGWFTEDFTLAELKSLRARERLPALRSTAHDGIETIPTLQEIIDLAKAQEAETGRRIGLYPETKHPSYFAGLGLAMEAPLVAQLAANGYDSAADPVFLQSFEVGNLQALDRMTELRLIQLMAPGMAPWDFQLAGDPRGYDDLASPAGLAFIAGYADGIGVAKTMVVPRDAAERSLPPTPLVADAHAAGLDVHVWTFRNENMFLAADFRRADAAHGDAQGELAQFLATGIDGVFADFPDEAVAARAALRAGR